MPWLGFFDKASRADTFVLLDHVQYRHRYFQNRNRIYGPTGAQWLTVPVVVKGRYTQRFDEVMIDRAGSPRWADTCWKRLSHAYSRAPYFAAHHDFFERLFHAPWPRLVDLNIALIEHLLAAFALDARIVRSSDLAAGRQKGELMLELCERLGATTYLSGVSGVDYLDTARFERAGINVVFQSFHHPVYRQVSQPFIPCLSAVDLLFTHGPAAVPILRGIGVEVMDQVFT